MYFDNFNLSQHKTPLDQVVSHFEGNFKHTLIIGNGGSSTMASHVAVDFLLLGRLASSLSDQAVITALSNDFGYEYVYSKQIDVWPECGNLIAISSSGNSKNIVNGVLSAKQKKYNIFTFTGFSLDNKLFGLGNINIRVSSFDYGIVESSHAVMLHYVINCLKGV